jgi:alpha-tubulin suppressor-like RCC1 family protein
MSCRDQVTDSGRNQYSETFEPVPSITGVADIAAGAEHTILRMNDGTIKAAGSNKSGQLGLGNTVNQIGFETVPLISGVAAVAAGNYHSVLLLNDGSLLVTGKNTNSTGTCGQLGLGDNVPDKDTFTPVPGISGVAAVAAGGEHTILLMNDGTIMAAGYNGFGQLGLGDTEDRTTFVPVPGISEISAVAAGNSFTLLLRKDGKILVTGHNYYGQLGLGDTADRRSFELVP